ncbi:IS481 family transposase [Caballeronia jiangsuensis]|jgi:transposase InsO family protein|uniref:IS481 family transposase n=1 Tax=Caballeronia jiangsuensis TaxID=1458357 RepID=A0ABW9CXM0_9BURK
MPWNPQNIMQLRLDFVSLALKREIPFSELCRRFGISRQTGYKILRRYELGGDQALADLSRRPLTSPRISAPELEQQVLQLRDAHPAWGARKLSRRLIDMGLAKLAPSTVNSILHRHGRIGQKASADATAWQRFERGEPNELWQMDFKGDFLILDQTRCFPLTVLDDHSRYNVVLHACGATDGNTVRAQLERAFTCYGLPAQINTDNGAPWGSPGKPGQLSELAIWLIRLGIRVTYSRPYHPQTNGKDERFHRSLKAEVLNGRSFTTQAQVQSEFDYWREIYNHQRPHQGIGMATPITRYRSSPRAMPSTLAPIEYGPDDEVLRVGWNGKITFRGYQLRVSSALHRLDVAARMNPEIADAYDFYFAHHRLMTFDPNQPDASR